GSAVVDPRDELAAAGQLEHRRPVLVARLRVVLPAARIDPVRHLAYLGAMKPLRFIDVAANACQHDSHGHVRSGRLSFARCLSRNAAYMSIRPLGGCAAVDNTLVMERLRDGDRMRSG